MSKLTPQREHFCLEMTKPQANQTKAYRTAFNTKGMKASTVHREACELMKDPKITARIAELMKPAVEKVQLTLEQWVEDGLKLYRANPRKLFDQFGNTVPITELGDDEITLIEGFKFTRTTRRSRNRTAAQMRYQPASPRTTRSPRLRAGTSTREGS